MQKRIVTLIVCVAALVPSLIAQTGSRVERHTFHSPALGVDKAYYIYLPGGYDSSTARYPVVYFLRQHEYEWFDGSLSGRNGRTLKNVADSLMDGGIIGKMILVGPGTGSDDSRIYACVNMLHPELTTSPGVGTGRFEDYFVQDMIPHIDATYRTISDRAHRGIDGFSLGGFASTLLAVRNPQLFCSVGGYDGSLMWYNLVNYAGAPDPLWYSTGYDVLFGPLFGVPRDAPYMMNFSVTNLLMAAAPARLDSIRSMRFHLHSAYSNDVGNLYRNMQFVDSLAVQGIINTFPDLILSPTATHTFGCADMHAGMSLVKHWETFQQITAVRGTHRGVPVSAELSQNYPNPFNPTTTINFVLAVDGKVSLKVFDVLGREVATLVNGEMNAGITHTAVFDGASLSSGVYFYRLEAGKTIQTKKLLLLR